jgi:hypothetical protein
MAREAKVIITSENKAQAGIKGAVRDLVGFDDAAKKVGDSIKNAFSILAVAAFTKKVAEFGAESVKAFGEVERKMTQLKVALGGNEESFARMNAHIQSLSRVSLSSKGDIQALVSQLAALGKSDADIERISEAAVNLANVTGQGLNEAMKQVNATFSGSTDELGKLIPELKGLTKEQLASGGAVDLLNEKFGALSKEMGDGVSQRLKNLNDDFGDLKENIGESLLVAFNPMVTFINTVITGWNKAYDAHKRYKNALVDDPVLAGYLKKQADAQKALSQYLDRVNTTDASGIMGMAADPEAERRLRAALGAAQRIVQEYELAKSGKTGLETDPIATVTLPGTGSGGTGSAGSGAGVPAPFQGGAEWADPNVRVYDFPAAPAAAAGPSFLDEVLGDVSEQFMGLLGSLGPIMDIMDPIGVVLESMFEVLGPLIEEALAPLLGILKIFGKIMAATLVPVLNLLTPVIELVAKVMLWFANKVMIPVANFIINIWNGIARMLNALLGWAGVEIAYAANVGTVGMEDATAAGTTTTGGTPGASYTGSQPITFNFYNQGNVVGSGGLEELAALLFGIIQRDARYA